VRREVKSGKRRKRREHEEKQKDSLFSFLKSVHRVHDASETTEETKAVAAMSNEGVKASETLDPQLHANDVADSVKFEDKGVENTTKSGEKCTLAKTEDSTDFVEVPCQFQVYWDIRVPQIFLPCLLDLRVPQMHAIISVPSFMVSGMIFAPKQTNIDFSFVCSRERRSCACTFYILSSDLHLLR
jgi:hypothetical protein